MKRLLSVLFLAAVATVPASAGLKRIRAEAHSGDVRMQLQLGELYQYGFGLHNHDVPALAWYLVAAHAGDAQAKRFAAGLEKAMTAPAISQARAQSDVLIRGIPSKPGSGVAPTPHPNTHP